MWPAVLCSSVNTLKGDRQAEAHLSPNRFDFIGGGDFCFFVGRLPDGISA